MSIISAGTLSLRPGARPAIVGATASPWPARLAQGCPAAELAARMAALHALCAGGHHVAASLAVRVAQGRQSAVDGPMRHALRLAVLRDHLRQIGHDWPMHGLGRTVPALSPLQAPVWSRGDEAALDALPGWLQAQWIGWPLQRLVAAWQDDPDRATRDWLRTAQTPLAALLATWWPELQATTTPHRPLSLAAALGASFIAPNGLVPDTGPWQRLNDASAHPAHNAGMRLMSRLIDLLRLAGPAGAEHLSLDAIDAGAGEGHAWVEVGRGLLSYRVRLMDDMDGPRIADLALQTPTDWNAHPQGVLAEVLAALPATGSARRARQLAMVWDPCLPCSVQDGHAAATASEAAHA